MSRLRGAHRAPERQGRRLRVLQTLPSRRDCAAMDPGTGSRSDARMASALRRCAVVLRLVAHPRTPARRRGAQTTTSRRMARAVHCHRSVRELGGGRRGRLRRRLNAWASNAVDKRTCSCVWPSVNGSAEGRRERFCHSVVWTRSEVVDRGWLLGNASARKGRLQVVAGLVVSKQTGDTPKRGIAGPPTGRSQRAGPAPHEQV